ncbi:MAG: PHP domain-containing protein [Lachnospiraceae bacterium]|nr:PHP domain-containing protein [Lachnospiraceae bacterium]
MTDLYYDLHIHSCLSPCGDNDMTPANIAGMAHVKGLDIIALTDHNACRNAPYVMKAAQAYGITVIPGMELTTSEEAHVVCLFPDIEAALAFDAFVYERLQKVENRKDIFGDQLIMNEEDEVLGEEPYLLINATTISFDDVFEILKPYDGLMIPAHLDKETDSIISQLGAIPPTALFTVAEIKNPARTEEMINAHSYLKRCRIITDSDAHYLGDIAEPVRTLALLHARPSAKEVIEVLREEAATGGKQ